MKHCADRRLRWIKWFVPPVIIALVIALLVVQPFAHDRLQAYVPASSETISQRLDKKSLNDEDYQMIFSKTGLGKCAVDKLRASADYSKEDILKFQSAFFSKKETECVKTSPVTKQDRIKLKNGGQIPMADVEDGDILISFSSHTFGWHHGHAGIVVDAETDTCLEAIVIGCDSEFTKLSHWNRYSGFAILRLRDASQRERAAIAEYAEKKLCDIPYSLASGVFGEKAPSDEDGLTAQCAYLIWYAYARFGFDLDSDGGRIVTVKDLAESPELKAVQVFGLDPEQFFWR